MSVLLRFPFLIVAFGLAAPVALAQPQVIGETTKVVREVEGTVEDLHRALADSDKVHRVELIQTAADSGTKLVFADGSKLSIGPNSEVVLDEFVYAGEESDRSVIKLTKGVLRFVSGSMNKEGVEIQTPAATIGIRGTNFVVSSEDAQKTVLLMDKEGETRIAGTCVGVAAAELEACQQPLDVDLGDAAIVPFGAAPIHIPEGAGTGAPDNEDIQTTQQQAAGMDEMLDDAADDQPGYKPDVPPFIHPTFQTFPNTPPHVEVPDIFIPDTAPPPPPQQPIVPPGAAGPPPGTNVPPGTNIPTAPPNAPPPPPPPPPPPQQPPGPPPGMPHF